MSGDFTKGQQPCQDFKGKEGYYGIAVHECYCGLDVGKNCTKTVSFCLNCSTDHHEDGYESCICGGKGWNQ